MFKSERTANTLAKRAAALKARMSEDDRCALAADLGDIIDQDETQEQERLIALEIITKLLNDKIERVRAAMAQSIAESPHLPPATAAQIARDINSVALPVLELSPSLTDQVLEEIILSGTTEKIVAIAKRHSLSHRLTQQIVASGRTPAVKALLDNTHISLEDQTLTTIIRVYSDDQKIEHSLLNRGELPDTVVNTLYTLTEAHVTTFIKRYFNLPERVIAVQKGRNLLKEVPNEPAPNAWWDTKKGVV